MSIIQTLILGIVEGLTEFLPISSTFHLIWTSKLLSIPQTDFQKLFEVVIQSGAILAVITLYFTEVIRNQKLIKNLIYSFLPTAIVGLILYKSIKEVFFENLYLQLGVFILVGLVFIIFEKRKAKLSKSIDDLTMKESVLIGAAQSLAVIPGVSRAGAVMIAMMGLGIKRDESAKYSFLLAVPTILSAGAYDLYKSKDLLTSRFDGSGIMVLGFVVSAISAFVVVRWFIGYLQKHDLSKFGWYRIILGIILLLILNL